MSHCGGDNEGVFIKRGRIRVCGIELTFSNATIGLQYVSTVITILCSVLLPCVRVRLIQFVVGTRVSLSKS